MKVSVITAAFNAAATIEDTIISVLSQSHADIEYIVVDGASTDGTLDIINRYRDRIAKIVSEPDKGIYDAMNKGLAASSGEVVAFLNADDVYANNRVVEVVASAFRKDDTDAVFGDIVFVSAKSPQRVVRRYRSNRFSPARIAWGWMPAHPAMFVHRRVFDRFGPFRVDYRIAGDFEFVARSFGSGTLSYRFIDEVLVKMRRGGASTGGWRSTVLLNREVLRACQENGIASNMFMILSKYPTKLLEFLRR